jgi:hypothetical protein
MKRFDDDCMWGYGRSAYVNYVEKVYLPLSAEAKSYHFLFQQIISHQYFSFGFGIMVDVETKS